ncbi:SMI1/KNR4 family protein [Gordonia sp. MP11Mi]|uniref:SMI1/KNR4 family protein n=1 Tax=Gordonia sp. MP11Mi TaxID=3022769 RepID=UPI003B22885E
MSHKTVVGAPASEASIRAAEERIGFRIDAGYRDFLTVASGWRQQQEVWNLHSAEELGDDILIEAPDPTQPMYRLPWAEAIDLRQHTWGIGMAELEFPPEIVDWDEVIPVGGTDGLGGCIYMLCTPLDESPRAPGPIFVITPGFVERYETFTEYLEAGITEDRELIANPSLWQT